MALWYRPSGGHLQKIQHLSATAGMSEKCNVVRIASEVCDVFTHPFQRRDQIIVGIITGIRVLLAVCGQIQKAQGVQTMGHSHNHNIAVFGKAFAVLIQIVAESAASAMEPEHHRFFCIGIEGWTPDIQILAILIRGPEIRHGNDPSGAGMGKGHRARRDGSMDNRFLYSAPRSYGPRFFKTSRISILHAEEGVNTITAHSPKAPRPGIGLGDPGAVFKRFYFACKHANLLHQMGNCRQGIHRLCRSTSSRSNPTPVRVF